MSVISTIDLQIAAAKIRELKKTAIPAASQVAYTFIGDEHAGRTVELETQPKRYADEWPEDQE